MQGGDAHAAERVQTGLLLAAASAQFFESHFGRQARDQLKQILSSPRAQAHTIARAKALGALGFMEWSAGNLGGARGMLQEAVTTGRELGDKLTVAWSLVYLGAVADFEGDHASAPSFLEEALAVSGEFGVVGKKIRGVALAFLGDTRFDLGDYQQAQILYDESIALLRELQTKNILAYSLRRSGYLALHEGHYSKAKSSLEESLALNEETGHQLGVTACVAGLAGVIAAEGETFRALELFGAVDSSLNAIESSLFSPDEIEYTRNLAAVRAQLDEATRSAAWARGQAMTLDKAVDYAVEKVGK